MIRLDKKLQCNINREAANISALSSNKFNKDEILQAKKYYHLIKNKFYNILSLLILLLVKLLEKQIKTIEDPGEKQIKAIHNQGQVKTIKNMIMMMKIVH